MPRLSFYAISAIFALFSPVQARCRSEQPAKQSAPSVIVIAEDHVQHDQQQNQPDAAAAALIARILARARRTVLRRRRWRRRTAAFLSALLPALRLTALHALFRALRPAVIPLFSHKKTSIGCKISNRYFILCRSSDFCYSLHLS